MPSYHAKLTADLDANTSGLKRGMREAQTSVKRMDRSVSKLKRSLLGLATGAAFGGLIASLKSLTAEGDKLAKFGARIGESVENLSALGFAADIAGVDINTMTMAMQRSTRRISEAAVGVGEAGKALEELGLDAGQLARMNPARQLEVIAMAMQGVTNQADRVRLAMRLFDSEGVAMLQMVNAGGLGLREMTDRARELGGVLDAQTAATMAQWNDTMTEAGFAVKAIGLDLLNLFGPALVWVTERIRDLIVAVRSLGKELTESVDVAAQWFAAMTTGQVGFWEWLTSGPDAARARMEEMGMFLSSLRRLEGACAPIAKIDQTFKGLTITIKKSAGATQQLGDEWDDVLDIYEREEAANQRRWAEQQAGINKTTEETDKLKQSAIALDFAFQSAFEDAILSGGKLGDVLKGLAMDIAKIFIRQNLTAPLASAASGFFSNLFDGFHAGGGIAHGGKISVVGEAGPELIMPANDTAVVPLTGTGMHVTNNWDFTGANPATVQLLRQESGRIVEMSKGAVLQAIEQGGSYARSVGRRV